MADEDSAPQLRHADGGAMQRPVSSGGGGDPSAADTSMCDTATVPPPAVIAGLCPCCSFLLINWKSTVAKSTSCQYASNTPMCRQRAVAVAPDINSAAAFMVAASGATQLHYVQLEAYPCRADAELSVIDVCCNTDTCGVRSSHAVTTCCTTLDSHAGTRSTKLELFFASPVNLHAVMRAPRCTVSQRSSLQACAGLQLHAHCET
jgi:hypothetical protein